jgi:hypothetical protein
MDTASDTAYVVRNRSGHVVVMFWGNPATAAAEAQDWAERRGYTVERAVLDEVTGAPRAVAS